MRLIALEKARDPAAGPRHVCDRLRVPLARLAGVAGYRSLVSRAVALAKAESPALNSAQVLDDGSITGLDAVAADSGLVVVAQLLGLLITFIGDPLTRQLVADTWPEVAVDDPDGRAGRQP
ncbi:MAG TPA: hypothetical protein VHR66_05655 [Gemmataceae bacterium]|nr:hypothetical protein [Gemmataceae bacterium]